jgi:N-acetylglucosaminyldiphosphoundecaprenol N-acetyl-beta-D-mannosaminyltransferase
MRSLPKLPVLNVEISTLEREAALDAFKGSRFVFTPNVDHLYNLSQNRSFYEVYQQADLLLCDSRIISLFSKAVWRKHLPHLTGVDFFRALCSKGPRPDFRVFLLGGSTPEHTRLAHQRINRTYGSVVVGSYSPPFGFEWNAVEIEGIAERVKQSGANVLVVGVGSPKQELFIARHHHRFENVEHFMGLGATIDFESGLARRAPAWMTKAGLEWLFRFTQEPGRLFQRYFVNDPKVLFDLIRFTNGRYQNPWGDVNKVSTSSRKLS